MDDGAVAVRPLSLKQVRSVVAVAQIGSMAQAARALHMTQPALSRAIAGAETALGMAIFHRGWNGSEATGFGKKVVDVCIGALDRIARAENDIAEITGRQPSLRGFLTWSHLDTIAAVVQLGSISHAAAHLHVSQPAISRIIAGAVRCVNHPLFERRNAGMVASPVATRLAVLRQDLLSLLAMPNFHLSPEDTSLAGRLAVGTLPFSSLDQVSMAIGALIGGYPGVRISSMPGNYGSLSRALGRGEIDCMIGGLRGDFAHPDLAETFLFRERFVLIARRDHPCHDRPATLAKLRDESWIAPSHGTPGRRYLKQLFSTMGLDAPARISEIMDSRLVEEVVRHTDAVALHLCSDEYRSRLPAGLRIIDIELADDWVPIGLSVLKTGAANPLVDAFSQVLRDSLTDPSAPATPL